MKQKPEIAVIAIIAIVARDGAIGRRGDQPFHISEDFRRFNQLTMGHPIVMGRRTFEALPKGALPGRRNIVVSRNATYEPVGAERVSSIAEAVELCTGSPVVFIIGGGQIYEQALPFASVMYLTEVDAFVDDADTFFPPIPAGWVHTERSDSFTDPRSSATYRFVTYRRDT